MCCRTLDPHTPCLRVQYQGYPDGSRNRRRPPSVDQSDLEEPWAHPSQIKVSSQPKGQEASEVREGKEESQFSEGGVQGWNRRRRSLRGREEWYFQGRQGCSAVGRTPPVLVHYSLIFRVRLTIVTIRHPRAYQVLNLCLIFRIAPKRVHQIREIHAPKLQKVECETRTRTGRRTGRRCPDRDETPRYCQATQEPKPRRSTSGRVYRPGVTIVRMYPPYGVL